MSNNPVAGVGIRARALIITVAIVAAFGLGGCGASQEGGPKQSGGGHPYRGTGYELTAPEPWTAVTANAQRSINPLIDLMIAKSSTPGSTSVNVVRDTLADDVTLADYGRRAEEYFQSAGVDLDPSEDRRLSSERAKALTARVEKDGQRLQLRQVIAKHAGSIYTVTLSAKVDAFDRDSRAFDAILASWKWR